MAIDIKATGHAVCATGVRVRPILSSERAEWERLMDERHPQGSAQLAGHQMRYVAEYRGRTVALLSFSACAYHLADRDRWIGWSREQTVQRRHFVVQNSRYLVVLDDPPKNLASRVLARCTQRVPGDWKERFGYSPALAETFVDPVRFRGTCYSAAGWLQIGMTRGFRRDGREFYSPDSTPKQIWVKALREDARDVLRGEVLPADLKPFEKAAPERRVADRLGSTGLRSLFDALRQIDDPRGSQGKRHSLPCCLAIMVCAILAGCEGHRECAAFAAGLTQAQRRALRCWHPKGSSKYEVPCAITFWRLPRKLDAGQVEEVVNAWLKADQYLPTAVAIDGKTLRATLHNEEGAVCAVSAFAHAGSPPFSLRSLSRRAAKSPAPRI